MDPTLGRIPIVMPIDHVLEHPWLFNHGLVQNTIKRFSEHPDFIVTLPDKLSYRDLGRRLAREVSLPRNRIWVGSEDPWNRLFQLMENQHASHTMVIPENACGMPFEAVSFLRGLVQESEIDLVYSDQILGLLPLLISRRLLRKRAARFAAARMPLRNLNHSNELILVDRLFSVKIFNPKPVNNERIEDQSGILYELCDDRDKTQNIRFFEPAVSQRPVHYLPKLSRDRALANYLTNHADSLGNTLRSVARLPESASSPLAAYFKQFCDTFAVTYPLYDLIGEPDIPEEIRGLTSNPKSIGDCYLRAINFTRFLKDYAGLNSTSRILDVGCGWGLLGLGLINVVEKPGSYTGIDIQRDAVAWAQKNLTALNPRLSFGHLDIANTRYNPDGSVPHDQALLPIENDSVDLVVFSSVFTHMRRDGVEQYLKESRRVLKKGGIIAFSYFHSSFFGDNEDYKIRFPDNPDRMTLFSTREIQRILSRCGLVQAQPQVNYTGRFNSSKSFFQTFMFATK